MKLVRFVPLLLAASIGLTGCLQTKPVTLYRLDNGDPQMPERSTGTAVLVESVKLADYLQGDAIVQRMADGSLRVDRAQGRWAGSLAEDIDQLMLRQLAAQLNSQDLTLPPVQQGFSPELKVELSVTRLDSGPEQPAVLEARWRLFDKDGKQQASRLVRLEESHDGTTADQVRAQSELLQRLSQDLASAMQPSLTKARSRSEAGEQKKASSDEREEDAARPVVPLRTEMEVFRF